MMDMNYFKEHIMEELADAVAYAKKAVEVKNKRPKWCCAYQHMSRNEIQHAGYLRKMMEEALYEDSDRTEAEKMYGEVLDEFTKSMAETESLYDLCKGKYS